MFRMRGTTFSVWRKGVTQVSLLAWRPIHSWMHTGWGDIDFQDQCSCHFPIQHPCPLNSKHTCTHLCWSQWVRCIVGVLLFLSLVHTSLFICGVGQMMVICAAADSDCFVNQQNPGLRPYLTPFLTFSSGYTSLNGHAFPCM